MAFFIAAAPPSPVPSAAPELSRREFDSFDEARLERVLEVAPAVHAWSRRAQDARAPDLPGTTARALRTLSLGQIAAEYRRLGDVAALEARIRMPLAAYARDQSILLIAYWDMVMKESLAEVRAAEAQGIEELEKLAGDPQAPEDARQEARRQIETMKATSAVAGLGMPYEIPGSTRTLVTRHRVRIEKAFGLTPGAVGAGAAPPGEGPRPASASPGGAAEATDGR